MRLTVSNEFEKSRRFWHILVSYILRIMPFDPPELLRPNGTEKALAPADGREKEMIETYQDIKVLVIDDDEKILDLAWKILIKHGFDVYLAPDGERGVALFKRENPTIVLTDINLPKMSGLDLLKIIKNESPITQVIVFSGLRAIGNVIEALRQGASDYLMKPFNVELLVHTVVRCVERYELIKERKGRRAALEKIVQKRTEALTHTFYETIKTLGLLTEKRDPYTAGHQNRVALLAMGIGRKLGLTKSELEIIQVAGLLHDIGKVAVPVELLSKPSKLTTLETELIKSHPQASFDILKNIPFTEILKKDISVIVLQHHERLDGSGYPQGLKSDELELETKLLCVSDVVEAMLSHRPYRAAQPISMTIREMTNGKGRLYASECVDACLQLIGDTHNDAQRLFHYLTQKSRIT